MPLPQVNDRLKEVPAQALRTLFASIGQLLLVADRLRARAAEQLSGSGDAAHGQPSEQSAAAAPPAAPPAPAAPAAPAAAPAQDAESARWRSLDKTGNVRLLGEDEEQEDQAVPAPVTGDAQEPVPAPAEYTPTEVVPAVSAQAEHASAEPPPAETASPEPPQAETAATSPADLAPDAPAPADVPAPADLVPDAPAPAHVPASADSTPAAPPPADLIPDTPAPGLTPADPALAAPPAPVAGEALPVPNYDELTVASLRARLRVLDVTQVQILLDYEKAHEGRPAVVTMFERRLTKLSEGS